MPRPPIFDDGEFWLAERPCRLNFHRGATKAGGNDGAATFTSDSSGADGGTAPRPRLPAPLAATPGENACDDTAFLGREALPVLQRYNQSSLLFRAELGPVGRRLRAREQQLWAAKEHAAAASSAPSSPGGPGRPVAAVSHEKQRKQLAALGGVVVPARESQRLFVYSRLLQPPPDAQQASRRRPRASQPWRRTRIWLEPLRTHAVSARAVLHWSFNDGSDGGNDDDAEQQQEDDAAASAWDHFAVVEFGSAVEHAPLPRSEYAALPPLFARGRAASAHAGSATREEEQVYVVSLPAPCGLQILPRTALMGDALVASLRWAARNEEPLRVPASLPSVLPVQWPAAAGAEGARQRLVVSALVLAPALVGHHAQQQKQPALEQQQGAAGGSQRAPRVACTAFHLQVELGLSGSSSRAPRKATFRSAVVRVYGFPPPSVLLVQPSFAVDVDDSILDRVTADTPVRIRLVQREGIHPDGGARPSLVVTAQRRCRWGQLASFERRVVPLFKSDHDATGASRA
jgi:hypothetical protein